MGAAGLDNGGLVRRYADLPKSFLVTLNAKGVSQICARPDAPAYIVAPVARDAKFDPALGAKLWSPPALRVDSNLVGDIVETTRFESYAILDCARNR